ncbi:MAG: hypothetical protein CVV27_20255 [Candidatus Melainabacteria bacterium HGW-Melainabacteria-1]|nr:MAG: hypothetical protein CVV27_20255 [Candidatus Melainabacteria bacterium HGW-Melainabacteria-1]
MKPDGEDLLKGARLAFQGLLARYQELDARIMAEVPAWHPDERFGAQLAKICVDIALLMIGADREYNQAEGQAFNNLFNLQESDSDISSLADWLQQQRPGASELINRLDRFQLAISVAERHTQLELLEPALEFFRTLGQVIAVIDEVYHPNENDFHERLNEWLQLSPPPPGLALRLKLRDGSLQPWPVSP